MGSNSVCRFNQIGYCKFKSSCFRKHENEICENAKCASSNCELRHPRKCTYFSRYSYCKFGEYCRFSHDKVENRSFGKEIEHLKSEIETLKSIIEAKESEIKEKDLEIRKLIEVHQNKMERKMDNLEKENVTLNEENDKLKETIAEMKIEEESLVNKRAVESMIFESFKEKMKLKYLYDSDDESSEYESDDEKREQSRELFRKRKQEQKNLKKNSDICDFTGKTTAGLKTHITKKHKEKS